MFTKENCKPVHLFVGLGSCLQLHSINGEYIDMYTSQDHVINCLAFSTAPEGQSINVIAGGLDNGVIR